MKALNSSEKIDFQLCASIEKYKILNKLPIIKITKAVKAIGDPTSRAFILLYCLFENNIFKKKW